MTTALGPAVADRPAALPGGRAPGERRARPPVRPAEPAGVRLRWWLLAVWLLALIMFLATDSGRMIFDTKLGVDVDPAGFLARLWPLWNPREWFGTLQDQYIGYAIPMAPFFLLGHLLFATWIVERLWLSVLVAVGFLGMVRLATELRVGSPRSRILAGAVFALWPTFTIIIGSTSGGVLPGILAPWAVIPLVQALTGRASCRTAAARSGVAIVLMGGVNATSTVCALVLPALFIALHGPVRRRVRLALWWVAAAAAATAWWVVPLLLQGRYSFNFLPYVEQAATTTRTMSGTAFLRGAGNWTAYLNLGTPWLSAGWSEVTSPAAILGSAAAAAAGLYGLARRDMPYRRWLLLCTGLVAAVALAGYPGPLGGVLHGHVDTLLNGPLAPFRNVYKLEPVAAAALALGCAHTAARCWRRAAALPTGSGRLACGAALLATTMLVLAGLAVPQLTGQILQPGSFPRVPQYWYRAAAYLAAKSATQTALVVPSEPHGTDLWGDPIDDPLEPLASSPWATRGLVPYGGPGSQTVLDTAENAIESGQRVPGLAGYLQRAGIRYLVVRNDLDPHTLGYASPQIVHETLRLSGFQPVASFGQRISPALTATGVPAELRPYLPSYPAVQIYQAAAASQRPHSPVQALPAAQTVLVNGGPDSLLQLSAQQISPGQPAVIAGDQLPVRPASWAVTDGLRRTDNAFGLTSANLSFTYTATERNPPDDPLGAGGQPPRQLLPVSAAGHQTVAVLSGAAAVTASSYGSWLTEDPQADPVYAFDGNQATAWTEGSAITPDGQWLQIAFSRPLDLPRSIGVRLLVDTPARSVANQLRVTTDAGSVTTTVLPVGSQQRIAVPPGVTRSLRITIVSASGVIAGAPGAGIRDVLIPGVRVSRYLKVPQDPAGLQAPAVQYSFGQQYLPQAGSTGAVTGVPAGPPASPTIARVFSTATAQPFTVTSTATPVAGRALDRLLTRLTPHRRSGLRVSATSTLGSQTQFGPANLFQREPRRPWVSSTANPVLHLRWPGTRLVDRLFIQPAFGFSAAPDRVQITSPAGNRTVKVGVSGQVTLNPPLLTNQLSISFPGGLAPSPAAAVPGQGELFGLGSINIPALDGLRVVTPPRTGTFHLACGDGPAMTIDGVPYPTAVSGNLNALVTQRPVRLRLCPAGGGLDLASGQHTLLAPASSLFSVSQISMRASSGQQPPATSPAGLTQRPVRVLHWGADSRAVSIGPGQQAYVEVHQNASAGWVARLHGKRLTPVTLDGWQQGYLVPAGQSGVISMTFTPTRLYHVGIVLSALAILVLLLAAFGIGRLIPARARGGLRRRWRRPAAPAGEQADSPVAAVTASAQSSGSGGAAGAVEDPAANDPGGADPGGADPGREASGAESATPADAIWPAQRPWPAERPWLAHPALVLGAAMAGRGAAQQRGTPAGHAAATRDGDPAEGPDGQAAAGQPGRQAAELAAGDHAGSAGQADTQQAGPAAGWLAALALTLLIFLAGGPVAIAVPVLALVGAWRPRLLPPVAVLGMLAAGAVTATAVNPASFGSGAFSAAAQAGALIALTATLMPAVHLPGRRAR
ncbi:MAG TPA: alpha-(1-_3)-arabinofuranosyltransferase family protein [Streptosporangiaceae bacterium]